MSNFLSWALRLVERGYTVVPIRPGSKAPGEDGWQNIKPDEKLIRQYARGAYARGNVGIATHATPAVDIDVYDEGVASAMEDYILEEIADAPVRVGQAPKRLLLFKTATPFRKLQATWFDKKDRKHKVEILGSGQQFVAYGVHPDTKKPFKWTSLEEPLETDVDDLPMLTAELANQILDKFDEICEELGWRRGPRSGGHTVSDGDASDFESYKQILALTPEKIEETLDLIGDEEDYAQWIEVGMALHHQFAGSSEGLQHWHHWSERGSNYEPEVVNAKWSSFGHGPATVTFATLLMKANAERERRADLAFTKAVNQINSCNSEKKLTTEILKELAESARDDIQADESVKRVQNRLKELKGVPVRLESVRKMFNALVPKKDREVREVPTWCENWVYIQRSNMFHNTKTGLQINTRAFDGSFGQYLLTEKMIQEGVYSGGRASDAALNRYKIPQVYDALYVPGAGDLFTMAGVDYVNLFAESSMPRARKATSPDELAAIRTIEAHCKMLFPNPRERDILLDYLAYTVQYPSEKIRWAMLIQGVSGAGKTFFFDLMAAALGTRNIELVKNNDLKENFTAWAQGSRMAFFEEIRLAGSDRFEILEKLLTYVANTTIKVRVMNKDGFKIPNVTNYVFLTMYMNALPLERTDRRYCVIRTSLQTDKDIEKFREENPDYFANLYDALELNGDIIRQWLLDREISDEFDPKGHAPETDAKELMRSESAGTSDTLIELQQLIDSGEHPLISEVVLSAQAVKDQLMLGNMPPRSFGALLADAGFAILVKARLSGNARDPLVSYYTRRSYKFANMDNAAIIARIRDLAEGDGLD